MLGAYTAAFEQIEQRLEDFDVHAMRGDGDDSDIELLVEMRKEVGNLRRALAAHRSANRAPSQEAARSCGGEPQEGDPLDLLTYK